LTGEEKRKDRREPPEFIVRRDVTVAPFVSAEQQVAGRFDYYGLTEVGERRLAAAGQTSLPET
jgi:hypothetical protein